MAVQGQSSINEFKLSFWDNLFEKSQFEVSTKEQLAQKFVTELKIVDVSYRYNNISSMFKRFIFLFFYLFCCFCLYFGLLFV